MKKATILVSGDILLVLAPANEQFRQLARDLNGKWNGVGYVFSPALQEEVEERCLDLFGRVLVRESHVVFGGSFQSEEPKAEQEIEFDEQTVVGLGADGRNPTKVSTVVRSVDAETGVPLQHEDGSLVVDIDVVNPDGLVDTTERTVLATPSRTGSKD